MKVYKTTINTKGSFKGWSSNLCWVIVKYLPEKDKFFFIKVWKQQSKNGKWLHPHFSEAQMEQIRSKAEWNYNKFILSDDKGVKDKQLIHTNKHHIEERCERCIELGSYCKNGYRRKNDNNNI